MDIKQKLTQYVASPSIAELRTFDPVELCRAALARIVELEAAQGLTVNLDDPEATPEMEALQNQQDRQDYTALIAELRFAGVQRSIDPVTRDLLRRARQALQGNGCHPAVIEGGDSP
jgi:hypothetical protein